MESIIFDTLTKLLNEKRRDNKKTQEVLDEIRGKMMFRIQYRGPETYTFMKKLVTNLVPIVPVYTTQKLRFIISGPKPTIEMSVRSNIVYRITCPNCSASYVGCTYRHLCTRIKEHFNSGGTMREHIQVCGVNFDGLENTVIIDSSPDSIKRLLILEALHIRELKPQLNKRDEFRSRRLRLRL